MHRTRTVSALIAIGLAVTVIVACVVWFKPTGARSNTHNETLRSTSATPIESLDSTRYNTHEAYTNIANSIVGLYGYNAHNQVVPELVKGQPAVSDHGKVYTFTLRHTTWNNGRPVQADDFVYAWQRLADPRTNSRNANRVDIFTNGYAVRTRKMPLTDLGVRALGKHTLRVHLVAANPYIKQILADVPYLPINRAYAVQQGAKYGTDSQHVLSNGPFVVSGWSGLTDHHWHLVKNTHYLFAHHVKINQVNITAYASPRAAASAFNGTLSDFTPLDYRLVPSYISNKHLHRMTTTSGAYLYFNTLSGPTMNRHLRKALAMSFDKHLFTAGQLQDGSQDLDGVIPANLSTNSHGADFRKTNGPLLPYNLNKAQPQWQEAQRDLNTNTTNISLTVANIPEAKQAATFLKGQWEHNLPGIKVNVHVTSLPNRINLEAKGDYQVIFSTWSPADGDPYNILDFEESNNNANIGGYSNHKYDAMLDTATQVNGHRPQQRWQGLQAAERYLLNEDAPTTGFYQVGLAYLRSERVKQLPISNSGTVRYEYARLY